MSRKRNWSKAKRVVDYEDRLGSGIALENGARTKTINEGQLARRAQREMIRWAGSLSTKDRMSIPHPRAIRGVPDERQKKFKSKKKTKD